MIEYDIIFELSNLFDFWYGLIKKKNALCPRTQKVSSTTKPWPSAFVRDQSVSPICREFRFLSNMLMCQQVSQWHWETSYQCRECKKSKQLSGVLNCMIIDQQRKRNWIFTTVEAPGKQCMVKLRVKMLRTSGSRSLVWPVAYSPFISYWFHTQFDLVTPAAVSRVSLPSAGCIRICRALELGVKMEVELRVFDAVSETETLKFG